MISKTTLLPMLAVCLVTGCPEVWGNALPAPASSAQCTSTSGIASTSGTTSCSVGGGNTYALGSIVLFPFVTLSANAGTVPGVGSFTTLLDESYSFEVTGGTAGDEVPILIGTSLSAMATGSSYGSASIQVETGLSDVVMSVCTDGSCAGSGFSGTLSVMAWSGGIDTVTILAEASAGLSTNGETASASADPSIFVDPTFLGASGYSILLSDGVGNGLPTTPEPGTWLLVLMAGAAMGFISRRRSVRALGRLRR